MPPVAPAVPHSSARALFAQECTHDTHYLNHKGDLYTALITGGNRVLMLKNGTVVAQSGPLFDPAPAPAKASPARADSGVYGHPSPAAAVGDGAWTQPRVFVVCICRFTDDVLRLAVATTAGIFVFEFDDAGLLWQDTRSSSFWRTADRDGADDDGLGAASPTTVTPTSAASGVNAGSVSNRVLAAHGRGATAGGAAFPSTGSSGTAAGVPLQRHSGMTGRLRWRRVAFSLDPPPPPPQSSSSAAARAAAAARGVAPHSTPYRGTVSSSLSATGGSSSGGGGGNAPVFIAPVRVAAPARPACVRAMDFVSEDALCVVLEAETALILLGNGGPVKPSSPYSTPAAAASYVSAPCGVPDRVVWRSLGSYRSLAVCRVNHHVALALGHSSVVVFPSRLVGGSGRVQVGGLPGDDDGGGSARAPFSAAASSFCNTNALLCDATVRSSGMLSRASSALRGVLGDSCGSSVIPTPAFSPTCHPYVVPPLPSGGSSPAPASAAPAGGLYVTLARQGLTTSVGSYHITDLRWHRVSSHTLLCVTCAHAREEASFMMLYTVQSLATTRQYTNVMEEHADGGWGLCGDGNDGDGGGLGKGSESIVQLVPAGVIALAYVPAPVMAGPTPCSGNTAVPMTAAESAAEQTLGRSATAVPVPDSPAVTANTTWGGAPPPPVAEMHTSLVPNFSRSAEANSMGSRMEFLHVEGDGTVRTSSYAFGRQKHASFAKQRAVGMASTELLQPLLHLFGSLVRVTVLPTWRTRPMELGHHTGKQPQAVEVLLNASRRYRLVLRFTSGVVLAAMVDLSAGVYRVESYLALGKAPLLSLRAISPLPELSAEAAGGVPGQAAVGTTTLLLVGLLGFPTASSPPAGKPKRLLTSSPSFLEEGEMDVALHEKPSSADSSSTSMPAGRGAAPHWTEPAAAASPPRAVWGVALLQVEPSGLQARVLTIAPLTEVAVAGIRDAALEPPQTTPQGGEDGAAAASAVTEEDVAAFIQEKCPEKLRFMPALLKATQQDAGRLMTQLVAKYGPSEKTPPYTAPPAGSKSVGSPTAAAPHDADGPSDGPALSPSQLRTGCVTEEGDVVLLLTAASDHARGAAIGSGVASTALVRIRPPCVEAFSPVQTLVAAGSAQVPFVATRAEYVSIPAALHQWAAASNAAAATLPSLVSGATAQESAAAVEGVCAGLRLCQRVSEREMASKTVLCQVVYRDAAHRGVSTPYVRVRSPLSPDGGEPTRLSSLQYLPLPPPASSKGSATHVKDVKGVLQVNNDVVVAVLCACSAGAAHPTRDGVTHAAQPHRTAAPPLGLRVSTSPPQSVLYLYGCPAVQSLASRPATSTCTGNAGQGSSGDNSEQLASAFVLEATLAGVEAFYLSASGELVVLRDAANADAGACAGPPSLRFERWLRCFPGDGATPSPGSVAGVGRAEDALSPPSSLPAGGYSYQQDLTWCPPCSHVSGSGGRGTVTAIATVAVLGAWEANVVGLSATAKLSDRTRAVTRPVLYAMADSSFIHLRQMPLRSGGDRSGGSGGESMRRRPGDAPAAPAPSGSVVGAAQDSVAPLAGLPQYHPDTVMQLIGMARWTVLGKVLTVVLRAAKATLAAAAASPSSQLAGGGSSPDDVCSAVFAQPADELARRLCSSAVARGFRDRPQVVQYDDALLRVTPPRLSAAALQDEFDASQTAATTSSSSASTTAAGAGGAAASSSATTANAHGLYALAATCGSLFADLTEVLPQVTLTGLTSQDQLTLLCILQALRDTLPISRSVDEAAARYLFFTRLMSLGRRLRLPKFDLSAAGAAASVAIPGVPVNSVLYFEAGRTATRAVATAAYLWAAMSDSQSTLVSLLFDRGSAVFLDGTAAAGLGAGEVAWEQVEHSGAAFWLRSAADLRGMADRVARHQYQRTKELTACALMYCTARKVGTLAALAKAQNNTRLHAFFSRDFAHDERHRAAASANAYAAISKNMPQYGAAFFLLAGDVRSAVQVLLQRCRDPFLALFVLRAAGEGMEQLPPTSAGSDSDGDAAPVASAAEAKTETLLQWYARQRVIEVEGCGPLDMWETACLSWMDATPQTAAEVTVQRRIAALQRIAAHPTAHPEALCALRYARDGVAALAYRGHQFLSPAHEVVCLLRLGRYCLAHRLHLNGYLHYRNAERLLDGMRAAAQQRVQLRQGEGEGSAGAGLRGGGQLRRPPQAKMAADFNTGTLTFRGFDSDDDDDDNVANGAQVAGKAGSSAQPGGSAAVDADDDGDAFVLSDEAEAAVRAEVRYAYTRCGARTQQQQDSDASGREGRSRVGAAAAAEGGVAPYEDVLRRMLLCFTSASSFMATSSVVAGDGAEATAASAAAAAATAAAGGTTSAGAASSTAAAAAGLPSHRHGPFQGLLTVLLRQLVRDMSGGHAADAETVVQSASFAVPGGAANASRSHATPSAYFSSASSSSRPAAHPVASRSAAPVVNGSIREPLKCAAEGWYSLCVPLLHLLLGKVALQEANYLVLLSLQRLPVSTEGVLEAAERAGLLREIFDRAAAAAAAGGGGERGSDDAAPGGFLSRLSPLYLPLIAFFRLLGRDILRFYTEACEAEEERQGGGVAGSPRGGARKVLSGAGDNDRDDDDDSGGEALHQNMFDALMAAAAAAEKASATGRAASFAVSGEGGEGRQPFLLEGEDGTRCAVEGADDNGESTNGAGAASRAAVTDAAQVSLLLSCCQSQLQLRLMEHLRHLARAELQAAVKTPTTQRAVDAGVLYADPLSPPALAMLMQRRVLLCTMLLDVTAQWTALSEEAMLRLYSALPQYAPGPLTDPNGVFLEVRLDVLRMRAVLVSLLAGPQGLAQAAAALATRDSADTQAPSASTESRAATTWLEEHTLMLLELCATQLEVFWTLPTHTLAQCRQLAAPTGAALRLLRSSTASHTLARRLLEGLLRPVSEPAPVLSRRSHTAPLVASGSLVPSGVVSPLARAASAWWAGPSADRAEAESATQEQAGNAAGSAARGPDDDAVFCPALSFLQLAWMRRHHTHALLRWLLLEITLDMGRGGGQRPLLTDRLILTQHSHAVTGVQFDASSCDSVVCTTEAGTSVGHGFRELLAGDNEEALWSQSTERNLATAAFTLGLAAQQERLQLATEHREDATHSPRVVAAVVSKSILESRPRCAVAANAMPSSHPHLPFFLSRHRDGHLDLYPFASQECIASFCCSLRHGQSSSGGGAAGGRGASNTWGSWGLASTTAAAAAGASSPGAVTAAAGAGTGGAFAGSPGRPVSPHGSMQRLERHAVTPVAFSPNGYIIAAGLSDGSVAGWRFAAAAVESAPAFVFPQLFVPYGIRACAFCGDRSSLMVVVGVAREPHPHPRARLGGTAMAHNATTPSMSASFSFSLPSPSSSAGSRGAAAAGDAGELVGEVVLLDTMLNSGVVTARCALPFVPAHAVYLAPLRAVLVVSSEGLVATYSILSGRLSILATQGIATVLQALASSGATIGGAGSGVSLPSSSISGGRGSGGGGVSSPSSSSFSAAAAAGSGSGSGEGSTVYVTCVAQSAYDPLVAVGTSCGLVLVLHLRQIRAAMRAAERRVRQDGEDVFVYYPPSAASSTAAGGSGGGGGAGQKSSSSSSSRRKATPAPPPSTPVSATSRAAAAAEVPAPAMGAEYMKKLPQESVLRAAMCVQVAPQLQSRSAVEDVVFSPSMLLAGLRDGKVMAVAVIAQATRTRLTVGSEVPVDLLEVQDCAA